MYEMYTVYFFFPIKFDLLLLIAQQENKNIVYHFFLSLQRFGINLIRFVNIIKDLLVS